MINTASYIVAILLLVPGIFMTLIPMLPAISYMLLVAMVFAFMSGFATLTRGEIIFLASITGLSIVIDHASGLLGAKYGGAHGKSILWGILGAILGSFAMPGIGSLAGLFLAVFLAEIYYKGHKEKALKAAGSALLGAAVGIGVNFVLSILFILAFAFMALG